MLPFPPPPRMKPQEPQPRMCTPGPCAHDALPRMHVYMWSSQRRGDVHIYSCRRIPRPSLPDPFKHTGTPSASLPCSISGKSPPLYFSGRSTRLPSLHLATNAQVEQAKEKGDVHICSRSLFGSLYSLSTPLPPPARDADSHECHEEPNAAHQAHEARASHTMKPMTPTTPTHLHMSPSRAHAELQPLLL